MSPTLPPVPTVPAPDLPDDPDQDRYVQVPDWQAWAEQVVDTIEAAVMERETSDDEPPVVDLDAVRSGVEAMQWPVTNIPGPPVFGPDEPIAAQVWSEVTS